VADAEGEEEDVAAVAFLVVAAGAAAAAAAFRVAVAAVFRGPVEEISPEEAPLGRAASIVRISVGLARGTFPTAAEAVVWLIPGTPHRATEVPLASD
jgi:hypothetical protein